MSSSSILVDSPLQRLAAYRSRLSEARRRARNLFEAGANGIQIAALLSEEMDALVAELFREALDGLAPAERALVEGQAAVVGIGGSGRGELAPYSDSDLLFLYKPPARAAFTKCAAQMVRDCWDAGIKLGHSVRTIGEAVSFARQEPEFATAIVEARLLRGSRELFETFRRQVARRVVGRRRKAFVADCLASRREERLQHGSTASMLQPDVKRSVGGLRDLHLLGWLGVARYGTADVESLRLKGALSREDARRLLAAREFLTRVRIDLHFASGKAQDVLTREEQLRIAEARRTEAPLGQRPVERFMQMYFQHSTAVAEIVERFVARQRPRPLGARLLGSVVTHRADGVFKVGPDGIDVLRKHRRTVCASLEQLLKLYHAVALNGVAPTAELIEKIKRSARRLDGHVSTEAAQWFLKILGCTGHLGSTLRSMYDAGVLELVVPNMAHARCLLQFNQYHSYTVDEHTLRAVEAATDFARDEGPVGTAYRTLKHKEILHLALLLHDLGKGFGEDHSDVGRLIADRMAVRLGLPDHHRETLVFLVHKHLRMAHLAFRRNISDPEILLEFSREVGSPEVLRMLYVLTAADLTAVGPGVWTDWKADLLTELFDRVMLILSGKHYQFHEQERLERVKDQVRVFVGPAGFENGPRDEKADWCNRRLDALPPHYLGTTSPEQIAADLRALSQLGPDDVFASGAGDAATGTVEYRIVTHENITAGCFHKATGVLTAKRLEILSANICTTQDGYVIDSFRVIDNDYAGEVPRSRIEEVCDSIRSALARKTPVELLFQKHMRFDDGAASDPVSDLETRVTIDNDSSDHSTILDVFAHDRRGLLYTLTRAIYDLGLSVLLAKISTHLDQVVDVFYVVDSDGRKIHDGERLKAIQSELSATIEEFEREGHRRFRS